MTVETFFANFGHLADAPNGVQKLRELILQLAVQGKLVPQDSEDEPASVLLERIDVERNKLVKAKEIRTKKVFEVDDTPYELPGSWSWVPIGNICRDWGQKVPDKKFSYIDVSAIDNERGIVAEPAMTEAADAPSRARKLVRPGTVIYSTVRPYLLNIAVIDKEFDPEAIASTAFAIVHPLGGVSSQYIFWFLRSPVFVGYVESKMLGVAYPAVNDSQFFSGLLPLPPLEEQKRIVAKVDQLMALCDELEARQQKQQQGRVRLNNAALDALLTAREPGEFADHWQRISTNFDLLYDHPETIAKLRAAILQLAAQGKLVPQDPNDEPASVLLDRVKIEKERLLAEGKLQKPKKLDPITEEDHLFTLPRHWKWVRLTEISEVTDPNPSHRMPKYTEQGIPFVSTENFSSDDRLNFMIGKKVHQQTLDEQIDRFEILPGTFALSRIGTIGKTRPLPRERTYCLSHALCVISPLSEDIDSRYLRHVVTADATLDQAHSSTKSIGVPDLGMGSIRSFVIPLPPLEEQKRIVAKVDQLMTLCGELEAKLNQTQQHSEKLMEATVRQLLVA